MEWGWNPQTECLCHKGTSCSVCMAYAMHLHTAAMEDDDSYSAAMDRRNSMFVPSSRFKREVERADHELAE